MISVYFHWREKQKPWDLWAVLFIYNPRTLLIPYGWEIYRDKVRRNCLLDSTALAKLAGRERIPNSSSNTCASVYRHGSMHVENRERALSSPVKPQPCVTGMRTARESSWGSWTHFSILAHDLDTDTQRQGRRARAELCRCSQFSGQVKGTHITRVLRKAKCTQISTMLLFNYCPSWCSWEISMNFWFHLCCPTLCFAKRGYHPLPLRNRTQVCTWCIYFLCFLTLHFQTNDKWTERKTLKLRTIHANENSAQIWKGNKKRNTNVLRAGTEESPPLWGSPLQQLLSMALHNPELHSPRDLSVAAWGPTPAACSVSCLSVRMRLLLQLTSYLHLDDSQPLSCSSLSCQLWSHIPSTMQ